MRFAVPALWLIAVHLVLAAACMAPAVHAAGMHDHAHVHHDMADTDDGECPHGHCSAFDESAPGGGGYEEWPAASLPVSVFDARDDALRSHPLSPVFVLPHDVGRLRSVVLRR